MWARGLALGSELARVELGDLCEHGFETFGNGCACLGSRCVANELFEPVHEDLGMDFGWYFGKRDNNGIKALR